MYPRSSIKYSIPACRVAYDRASRPCCLMKGDSKSHFSLLPRVFATGPARDVEDMSIQTARVVSAAVEVTLSFPRPSLPSMKILCFCGDRGDQHAHYRE